MSAPSEIRCVMLWIGELGPIERACMRSALRNGHPITLYTYGDVGPAPEGVEVADGREVLPTEAFERHQSGSVALFSDHFRFELQRQGRGVWLDSDAYLLRPLHLSSTGYLMGWQDSTSLGAGVLRLPETSPLIRPVLQLFESPYVPNWLRVIDRIRAYKRLLRNRKVELGHLPWGVAGPLALTALARKHEVLPEAVEPEVLYPWHWSDAAWIFDPTRSLDEFVTPKTRALHLYNHAIGDRKSHVPRAGSFFERVMDEGA